MPMVVYLIGASIALWLAHKWLRHEGGISTYTRTWMTLGVTIFSWIAVSLMATHLKLHYKYEIRSELESSIKQRNLLINERSCVSG